MGAQKAVGQRLVLAQQSEQQVLGLDIRRAELAGLVPREEDYTTCLLRIAFEHGRSPVRAIGQSSRPVQSGLGSRARALVSTSPPGPTRSALRSRTADRDKSFSLPLVRKKERPAPIPSTCVRRIQTIAGGVTDKTQKIPGTVLFLCKVPGVSVFGRQIDQSAGLKAQCSG